MVGFDGLHRNNDESVNFGRNVCHDLAFADVVDKSFSGSSQKSAQIRQLADVYCFPALADGSMSLPNNSNFSSFN